MTKKAKNIQFYEAVGKRKQARARIRLYVTGANKSITLNNMIIKSGEIMLNKKPIFQIFPTQDDKNRYLLPLKLTQTEDRFAISIHAEGGGKTGQLDAIINGLARAVEKVDPTAYRAVLKKKGLLTRDARVKERRKVGTGGKARRKKQSPKR